MTTQTYQEATQHLLSQAQAELAAGDIRQASEKGWGAAAQAVKAVCDERRWQHDSHALLHQAISRIVEETEDESVLHLFSVANLLHINFYENWLDERTVRHGLVAVDRLIERLDGIRDVPS